MKDAAAEVWVTDCPLAALQFEQHAGAKPMHPMSILARAYREGGFPTPVPAACGHGWRRHVRRSGCRAGEKTAATRSEGEDAS